MLRVSPVHAWLDGWPFLCLLDTSLLRVRNSQFRRPDQSFPLTPDHSAYIAIRRDSLLRLTALRGRYDDTTIQSPPASVAPGSCASLKSTVSK
jgi:hypothetical protein